MVNFGLLDFEQSIYLLIHWAELFLQASAAPGRTKLDAREKKTALDLLAKTRTHCHRLRLDHSLPQIARVERDFHSHLEGAFPSYSDAALHLRNLWNTIQEDLREKRFAFIAKSEFFEQDNVFGHEVSQAFPSALGDIRATGNCIAADLHTAAIFHLMRVAELGMRALAKHLKVTVKKTRKAKAALLCQGCSTPITAAVPASSTKVPLDYAMWEEVLAALSKKVLGIKSTVKKGTQRDELFEFYNGLIIELNAFKDLWRNPVSHCRRTFEEAHVDQAYPHVKDFMMRLSTKVRE
jgi:hypothetical protein